MPRIIEQVYDPRPCALHLCDVLSDRRMHCFEVGILDDLDFEIQFLQGSREQRHVIDGVLERPNFLIVSLVADEQRQPRFRNRRRRHEPKR